MFVGQGTYPAGWVSRSIGGLGNGVMVHAATWDTIKDRLNDDTRMINLGSDYCCDVRRQFASNIAQSRFDSITDSGFRAAAGNSRRPGTRNLGLLI